MNWLLLSLALIGSSCSHIVPKTARSMPVIKVSHKGQIESMGLETYVASVLAGEVSPSWPIEALKAQAIASRTFALKRMKERKGRSYHVENSYMDQVFRHMPDKIFVEAVRETAGLVLSFNGELAESSFHSTCGGHTANAKETWGQAYSYLEGVPCSFCTISPAYKWTTSMSTADLQKKLGAKIADIKVLKRASDERIMSLELNKQTKMSGHQFRMKAGPLKVKSTLIYDFKLKDKNIEMSGQGFGHGVGLCQYGTLGMARAGHTSEQILAHYYPKTSIKRLY